MAQPFESASSEKRLATITTTADPTGQAVEFAVGQGQSPSAWVAGSWVSSSWDGTAARALTPLMGQGAALDLAARGVWKVWVRWRVGTEVVVRLCGVLQVV